MLFRSLNEQFIRDYQEFCEQTKGLSNQTVRHYLALLKKICRIAFKEGYSEKYYFCHFKLPKQMDIDNTQYIIVRHHDTANEHLHIVYNRIDNNLKLISINNDYKRNIATCKKLKDRHNLTYGKGKEHVNRPKLNGADKTKYEIYDAMKLAIPKSHNITELSDNSKPYGIMLCLKCRRNSNH